MMRRMFEDMERLFGWPSAGVGGLEELEDAFELPRSMKSLWTPRIDVREKEGKLLVRADLPGLKSDDIQVNLEDDVLIISGERRDEFEGEREGVYRSEQCYGSFERRIALPQGIDPNAIDAKFENGVLQISAPLPQQASRGRRIDVKGGSRTLEEKQKH